MDINNNNWVIEMKSTEKTHKDDDEAAPELIRWKKRLSSLSEEQQKRISKKYYSGSMPWK